MAPIEPNTTDEAETAIRDTIQALYNIMLHTSAYDSAGPQTSVDALVGEVHALSQGLQGVSAVADAAATRPHGDHSKTSLPPVPRDLVQYVEAGRNPDIYTREFVELVRRTNQLRAGKSQAFSSFQNVLAEQIRTALPELSGDVERVVAATSSRASTSTGLVDCDKYSIAAVAAHQTNAAPAAVSATSAVPANSRSLSATASPQPHSLNNVNSSTNNEATPGSEPSVVDMLGMLPGTPQATGLPHANADATDAAGESRSGRPDGHPSQAT